MVDDELIPDGTVILGEDTGQFNDRLRELAVAKFDAHYDLDVDTSDLIVAEREGHLSVYVTTGAREDGKA